MKRQAMEDRKKIEKLLLSLLPKYKPDEIRQLINKLILDDLKRS